VTGNGDCEQYQDEMDRVFEGTASEADSSRLREHAASCPDCAMLFEMHRQLEGTSQAELEAAVPDHMVEGMWPRVELDIMRDSWREAGERRRSPVWRWVVAVQAAAIALLIAGSAYLFIELNRIRHDEAALIERIAVQDEWIETLEERTSPPEERPAAVTADFTRRRLPAGVTVAEATRYLERLPEDASVLGARDTRRLLTQLPYAFPGTGRETTAGIRADDGLQAGEALRLIASLNLDPSQRFPAGIIARLSAQYD
jgi:hypothetical protein